VVSRPWLRLENRHTGDAYRSAGNATGGESIVDLQGIAVAGLLTKPIASLAAGAVADRSR
jgi:hypothetical protein